MKLIETKLQGVYIIELEHIRDNRGFFTRGYCREDLKKLGIDMEVAQYNFSYNKERGTFRGMHYQTPPFGEKKIVSCVKGLIYDIVLDIRQDSETLGKSEAFILSDNLFYSVYIPEGCAHGFQTMSDDAIVHYTMSAPYSEKHYYRVSYKNFGIKLPLLITNISEKDNEQ
jgi:dTDP-4-dehydrorhamnose 3,5-epimerase